MSQDYSVQNDLNPNNTTSKVKKKRLAWTLSLGGTIYTGSTFALYDAWYKDYPSKGFHLYDDLGEWRGVDKAGHIFSGYFQSEWAYKTWLWTGMGEQRAVWTGVATGFLAMTTLEVMDGFSSEWGFSIGDFGANLIGIGGFAWQQSAWGEQRIRMKTSSAAIDYQERYGDALYQQRANELFGTGIFTRYLKDYNAQTTWISANIHSFFPDTGFPKWLNVAVGYGAGNMFGGYTNQIPLLDGSIDKHKRYSQFFISLDADLSKVDTSSPFLRTLLDIANVLKMPFSTIEINTLGEVKFYAFRF